MKTSGNDDDSIKYDLSRYENRARAWITAMMLISDIGKYPKDTSGNSLMAYQRVSNMCLC